MLELVFPRRGLPALSAGGHLWLLPSRHAVRFVRRRAGDRPRPGPLYRHTRPLTPH